jgi:UDP-GlcNAc:undecaprenyl-phosphate GlcNAc-1-phosphate transferase
MLRLLAAGSGARLAYAALRRRPPGGEKTWTRTNHRGEPVTLLEGPAAAVAAATAAMVMPGLDCRDKMALAAAGLGAGAFGCYDDLAGSGDRRGLKGHLGALAKGEVTTGAIKIIGLGVVGVTAALLRGGRQGGGTGGTGGTGAAGRLADLAIDAGLVAGTANLVNLFDLRPGRAIKVGLAASAALAVTGAKARAAVAAPAGAAIALLNEDLGERAMLGDAGANALGAMLGVAATSLPRPVRLAVLGGVAGLTLASEKVSFTKVIARTPALNWLDLLGRRPVAVQGPGGGGDQRVNGAGASGDPGQAANGSAGSGSAGSGSAGSGSAGSGSAGSGSAGSGSAGSGAGAHDAGDAPAPSAHRS